MFDLVLLWRLLPVQHEHLPGSDLHVIATPAGALSL